MRNKTAPLLKLELVNEGSYQLLIHIPKSNREATERPNNHSNTRNGVRGLRERIREATKP